MNTAVSTWHLPHFAVAADMRNLIPVGEDHRRCFGFDYLATFQAMSAYSTILTAAPARWDALESLADVELRNYGIAGAKGLPIPNLPEMDAVWSPWTDALVAILDGYRPAQDAFISAAEQIYQSINP